MKKVTFCLVVLLLFGTTSYVQSQSIIIHKGVGSSPVLNEDKAKARQAAILKAKQTIISELLPRFLTANVIEKSEKRLARQLLRKPDRFIESIQILREAESPDSSEFLVELEARVFEAQLLSALRRMKLPLKFSKKKQVAVRIKLQGLPGPQQELEFLQKTFQISPEWAQIRPYLFNPDHSIYRGLYSGNLKNVLPWIKRFQDPAFVLKETRFKNRELQLTIQWQEVLTPLVDYQPIPEVDRWLQEGSQLQPEKRVPLSSSKGIFSLPRGVLVYDFLRSRGDSTRFKIDWAKPGMKISLVWRRIGESNLQPSVSSYDAKEQAIAQVPAEKETQLKMSYELPAGQSAFYLKISDEIGFIPEEAASYLFLHYTLHAEVSE